MLVVVSLLLTLLLGDLSSSLPEDDDENRDDVDADGEDDLVAGLRSVGPTSEEEPALAMTSLNEPRQ